LLCAIAGAIVPFADLFSERVFEHAGALLVGAILAPGSEWGQSISIPVRSSTAKDADSTYYTMTVEIR
jgi:hypothetical protein